MLKRSTKFICSCLLCTIAPCTSSSLPVFAYSSKANVDKGVQEYRVGDDVLSVEETTKDGKKALVLSDDETKNVLVYDETGTNVISIIENGVEMSRDEFLAENEATITTTINYENITDCGMVNQRAADWVYAYTSTSNLSGKINNTVNIATLILMATPGGGSVSSFLGLATGILNFFGTSWGAPFSTSYRSLVYQDRNDRHSWKKVVHQYLQPNCVNYDRTTYTYFSTWTPI